MKNLFETVDNLEYFTIAERFKVGEASAKRRIVESVTGKPKLKENNLKEAEYTANARKCIDAANLLGQINLRDIENAAKIQDQIDKLFDKLVKLAPKLNKKEQKEAEEATKCNEDSESLKAAKVNMERLRKQYGFTKSEDKPGEGSNIDFVNGEARADLEKKANKVTKTMKDEKLNESSDYSDLELRISDEILDAMLTKGLDSTNYDEVSNFLETFQSKVITDYEDETGLELLWDISEDPQTTFKVNVWEL